MSDTVIEHTTAFECCTYIYIYNTKPAHARTRLCSVCCLLRFPVARGHAKKKWDFHLIRQLGQQKRNKFVRYSKYWLNCPRRVRIIWYLYFQIFVLRYLRANKFVCMQAVKYVRDLKNFIMRRRWIVCFYIQL